MKRFEYLYGVVVCCIVMIALMSVVILWETGVDKPVGNTDVISDTSNTISVNLKGE